MTTQHLKLISTNGRWWFYGQYCLEELLEELRKLPPDQRNDFYPSGGYFIYGADYLLINLIEIIERLEAQYIYPTNLNRFL